MTAYAEEIRAAAQALLTDEAIAAGRPYRLVRDTWGWPLAAADYPALSVFLPRELMTPDGAGNASEPSFIHDCTLGIIVQLGFARPEDLKDQLRVRTDAIFDTLLTTVSFRLPVPFEVPRFESIERGEIVTAFDQDGETFLAQSQINLTIRFRTDWPPVVPDDFETMAITLKRPGSPTPPEPTLVVTVPTA